jgi:hypothetical protein
MRKKWQSNTVFHTYYLQLKWAIESFLHMTTNTLDKFRPLMNFHADRNFIYITVHADESKEELQSYYKIIEEDLEKITKEWPTEYLIPIDQVELPDPKLIGNPLVTHEEYDSPNSIRKKNKEEVQQLDNLSEETASDSPSGRGGHKVDKEEKEGEEDKKNPGEVTSP